MGKKWSILKRGEKIKETKLNFNGKIPRNQIKIQCPMVGLCLGVVWERLDYLKKNSFRIHPTLLVHLKLIILSFIDQIRKEEENEED